MTSAEPKSVASAGRAETPEAGRTPTPADARREEAIVVLEGLIAMPPCDSKALLDRWLIDVERRTRERAGIECAEPLVLQDVLRQGCFDEEQRTIMR